MVRDKKKDQLNETNPFVFYSSADVCALLDDHDDADHYR